MQGRYQMRAAAAMFGLYGLDAEEAVYMEVTADADGHALDGSAHGYVLRFSREQPPPAGAFWSLTMYDEEGFMVSNDRRRYSIGDRTPGVKYGGDGSLTVYLQDTPPDPDKESNWLPAPHRPFSVTLRIFQPQSGSGGYVPPTIVSVR